MTKKIVFIHTIPALINEFNALGAKLYPEVQLVHLLDEMLLEQMALNHGKIDERLKARLWGHFHYADEIGANAILTTCSVFTNTIDELRPQFKLPIIKIDEALAELAVAQSEAIGLIVTNPDAVELSTQLLYNEAKRIDKQITIRSVFVDHAFAAVRKGDRATHDQLVKQAILQIMPVVDVIVLAQASMARTLDSLSEDERLVPILSSPQLALEKAVIASGLAAL